MSGEGTPEAARLAASSGAGITVQVKFSGRTVAVVVNPDSTVKDLKDLLQPLTNVLPRGQRLIYKGKVLTDSYSLKSSQISNGAKIMLVASQGLHQGDGPIRKDIMPVSRKVTMSNQTKQHASSTAMNKTQQERWRITGVVALSESSMKVIPEEVWACGSSARVLDASNNHIQEIPAQIGLLTSLNRLLLNRNDLSDTSISWESLSLMKSLLILSLEQNHLTCLPPAIGNLISLRELNIAQNMLTSLPNELGSLNQLQILKAGRNRLTSLPSSLGICISLVEIDASSNFLEEIPETLENLKSLKVLHLSNNGLKSLPRALLRSCSELSTLNLHGTEITNDVLRQMEGWEAFDERRRQKHQKQLDFRLGCSGGFDEGADESDRY